MRKHAGAAAGRFSYALLVHIVEVLERMGVAVTTGDSVWAQSNGSHLAAAHDVLMQYALTAGLHLHSALSSVEEEHASERIRCAVGSVDAILRGLREVALAVDPATPDGAREAAVRLAETLPRSTSPYQDNPTLIIDGSLRVIDDDTLSRAQELLAQILALQRPDTLAAMRVTVGTRLVVEIAAPNMVDVTAISREVPGVQIEARRTVPVK